MPIPDTKYNKITQLQTDISNASFKYGCHIITCDISDTILNNNINNPNKIYLTNKADTLIHPFSKTSNYVTQFNNEKSLFKYKKPARVPDNSITSHNEIQTQKIIQNQVRAPGSLFTMNLASLNINSDNLNNNTKPWHNASDRKEKHKNGIDIKHNSYDRYLGKKKSHYLKTQPEQPQPPNTKWPSYWGNKTRKFGLTNCVKTC